MACAGPARPGPERRRGGGGWRSVPPGRAQRGPPRGEGRRRACAGSGPRTRWTSRPVVESHRPPRRSPRAAPSTPRFRCVRRSRRARRRTARGRGAAHLVPPRRRAGARGRAPAASPGARRTSRRARARSAAAVTQRPMTSRVNQSSSWSHSATSVDRSLFGGSSSARSPRVSGRRPLRARVCSVGEPVCMSPTTPDGPVPAASTSMKATASAATEDDDGAAQGRTHPATVPRSSVRWSPVRPRHGAYVESLVQLLLGEVAALDVPHLEHLLADRPALLERRLRDLGRLLVADVLVQWRHHRG